MKTIISRLKTIVKDNGAGNPGGSGTFSYVMHVEAIHPDLGLTLISRASLPAIFFVPDRASEEWTASQEKEAVNRVLAYLIIAYQDREASIMGDSTRPGGQGKGIIDFVADFLSVFRGHQLQSGGQKYLNKPLSILNVDYIMSKMGDNASIMVAEIQMECRRLFLQTSLPGEI